MDDIFKCIFLDENIWIPIKISLKFVPRGPFNNIPALVQTMALRQPGDKPSFEPISDNLLTHIRVTRPQWLNRPVPKYKSHKLCTHSVGCTLFTTYFVFPDVCLSLRPGDPLSCSTGPTSWTTSSSCFWAEIQPNSCCLHFGDFVVFLSLEVPDFLKKKRLILWVSPHGWETTQRREWILDELRNRFCTISATDSWQRTRGHDECVHNMTNIIHNYRFVKPYIMHNIA